jgi:hypothetical protein
MNESRMLQLLNSAPTKDGHTLELLTDDADTPNRHCESCEASGTTCTGSSVATRAQASSNGTWTASSVTQS